MRDQLRIEQTRPPEGSREVERLTGVIDKDATAIKLAAKFQAL